MLLLNVLVLCIPLFCAADKPQQRPPPPPPLPITPPVPIACDDVQKEATEAINKINECREEGYIYAPFRVSSAYKQPVKFGTILLLTVDVLETNCYVWKKENLTKCEIRPFHEAGYGQCRTVLHSRENEKPVVMHWQCATQRVPAKVVTSRCPHCPVETDISPSILKDAKEMLQHVNRESNETNYFRLSNVTRASHQVTPVPVNYIEFTIEEMNCSKDTSDLQSCEPFHDGSAELGFCTGSVTHGRDTVFVDVSCEMFEPEDEDPDTECECGRPFLREHHDHKEDKDHHHEGRHEHHHGKEDGHHHKQHDRDSHQKGCGHHHGHGHGHRKHGQHDGDKHHPHEHNHDHPHGHGPDHGEGPGKNHGEQHEHGCSHDHHDRNHGRHQHGQGHHHSHGHGHHHHMHPHHHHRHHHCCPPEVSYVPPTHLPGNHESPSVGRDGPPPRRPDNAPRIFPFPDKPSAVGCPGKPANEMLEMLQLFSDTPATASPK
ncbi:fetuin-B-like [Protopterus annectens]|uniref:fetuin-B-like n=1 Tax=Protopterus annectens TaxID=7888 RepID=UPI001CFB5AEC|nr:fetuin-B-like [Protopterus annectens]